ncbi:rhamnogalacturonan lyase B N-terminal domain-containing protein [Streptomyces sp. YH02]|uniref:rhamnogalacturonan lyase B N-terminal domain-containing protein n=1 Tax=Streptomyces sp. YH02 TaxID=3256999 RepID=UPI003757CEDB
MSAYDDTPASAYDTAAQSLRRRTLLGAAVAGTAAVAAGGLGPGTATAAATAFGWSDDGGQYVVDTGAGLVFKVSKSTGDLTSLVYKGKEYEGYGGKHSHVESGLGASTVTLKQTGSTVLITVVHGTLRHYLAARSGRNNVYLWTDKADTSFTATRFIARLRPGIFPNEGPDSWVEGADTVIEAGDVWRRADGHTRSKHYSGVRVMDYEHIGYTTGSVGLWMIRSNHEKASGGPFYRSLLRHSNELGVGLYEILHYNQSQTEAMRFGLQGPYLLAFTDGGTPDPALSAANHDTSWVDGLGIPGWVGAAGRGRVAGVGLAGMAAGHAYTVGFANAEAQYWARAAAGTGAFSCRGMLPGTYTLTGSVTVTAGTATALHTITLTNDPSTAPALWRIGDWDGTPGGFKNAALMTYAHPADVRAAPWTGNVVLDGGDVSASFPCYLWKGVNDGVLVYFRLTAAQAAAAHTLRIGVTTAFLNGRPQVTVNDWVSTIPSPPTQPSTRSLTNGSYRGNNHTFSHIVPASAWKTDPSQYNVLKLNIVSGSSGTGFLSPGTAIDCVDLLV